MKNLICVKKAAIASLFVVQAGTIFAQPNIDIRLNQIGFYSKGPKSAAIVTNGNATTFTIKSADRIRTVFNGTLSVSSYWAQSGENVKIADFDSFSTPGTYVVEVPGLGYSYTFKIADNIFVDLNKAALKAYYYNRASTELLPIHAGIWARKAGHPDNEVIIHPSAASATRPTGTKVSSPKGWYDAGDYNCYVVNSGISTYQLMASYEHFTDYYKGLNLNIPESNNALPDILDEIRWNLDWMLTMQDPADGGVYHKKSNANFGGNEMPDKAITPRYMTPKTTAATLDFAAVMAVANRVYKVFNPTFAATCLAAAREAYDWAKANPSIGFVAPVAQGGYPAINTGPYESSNLTDEFDWAANELYIATKNDLYYADGFKNAKNYESLSWGRVSSLGLVSLITHRKNLTSKGFADTTNMKNKLLSQVNTLLTYQKNNSPYKIVMGSSGNNDFTWGSNGNAANKGFLLMNAYRMTGNQEYLSAAVSSLDYMLGKNAVAYSFVTGYGSQKIKNIHHRPSTADRIADPVPGWLVGGPSGPNDDNCPANATFLAKSISDQDCYSKTEVTINWNSPLVYLSSALSGYNNSIPTSLEFEEEDRVSQISIYPNPSNDGIFNLSQNSNWKVTSILGEELKSGNSNQINLSDHPKGLYLIKINEKIERVVVE